MQISLNDLLIKSSPSIYLPRCPNKSQYCFSTLRGNLRKIMATFASEAYGTEQTTASKTKTNTKTESKTLQKKHTTFFIANWVIKFIYTRRKAAQNELAELPRFFSFHIWVKSVGRGVPSTPKTPRDICEHAVSFFMAFHYNA